MNRNDVLLDEILYDTTHFFIEWRTRYNKESFRAEYSEQLTPLKLINFVIIHNSKNPSGSRMYVYFNKKDGKNNLVSSLISSIGGEENKNEVKKINKIILNILSKEENGSENMLIEDDTVFEKGDRVKVISLSENDFDDRLLNEKGTVIKELYYNNDEIFYLIDFDNEVYSGEMVSSDFNFDEIDSFNGVKKGKCWPIRPENLEKI